MSPRAQLDLFRTTLTLGVATIALLAGARFLPLEWAERLIVTVTVSAGLALSVTFMVLVAHLLGELERAQVASRQEVFDDDIPLGADAMPPPSGRVDSPVAGWTVVDGVPALRPGESWRGDGLRGELLAGPDARRI
jgi:hypothetical protein